MNWTRTILDGLAMAAYFNLFAAAVALYQAPARCFPAIRPPSSRRRTGPPTREPKTVFTGFGSALGSLLPLLLYGAVSAVEGGTTGFWRLALTGYIQWMVVNVCDLLFLDFWLIQKKAKRRFIISGTEGHPGYGFKAWMKEYALPRASAPVAALAVPPHGGGPGGIVSAAAKNLIIRRWFK